MATPDNYNPGRENVMPTAAPNIVTERARMDPQGNVDALLSALGSESTQNELARFNQQHEAKKLEEQKGKFEWYVEQFSKDHAGGAVSQAQIKERFPETVPVISSRIAEAIGQKEGRKLMEGVISEIASNDTLRLDTNARAAFIAQKRAELTANVGAGNEFFGAGLVQSIDRTLQQHEVNWQTETAGYHQKVQAEQFTGEVANALNSGNPKALLDLDAKFGVSSSLNNLERKKLVVDTAIDLAFTNDDPKLLQAVPQKFLSADSKAQLDKARVQLTDRRMVDFRNAQYLKEVQRTESERVGKTEIIQQVAATGTVDPAKYRNDPVLYQFAVQAKEIPRLDESRSVGNAQSIRNHILTQSTADDPPSVQALTDQIVANPNLNPKERQALIAELPKLVEGRNLMADDFVRQPISDRLNPRLQALEQSTNSAIQALLTGRNLRSEVMKGYDGDIRRSFMADFEETGKWPTGHRKLELIDKAVERAEKRLEEATRIGSAAPSGGAAATPRPAPRPAPAAAPTTLPKGVTKLD